MSAVLERIKAEIAAEGGKDWWTAKELVALGAGGLPNTVQGINARAEREGWRWQIMPGFGGPRGYHLQSLPEPVRVRIGKLLLRAQPRQDVVPALEEVAAEVMPAASAAGLVGPARRRMEARLAVLAAFDRFRLTAGISVSAAVTLFVAEYNAGGVEIDAETRAELPAIGRSTLHDWLKWRREDGATRLALRYRPTARSVIDTSPALQTAILGIVAYKPHLSAYDLHYAIAKALPANVTMPSLRSVQRWLKAWKAENQVVAGHLENPDKIKNRAKPAFGTYANVQRANQLWMLDATPGDALLIDGRNSVVACIDVATRRTLTLVTRTAKAWAVAALLRRCILAWGLPERIKTDNGSDFTSQAVTSAVAALGIEHELCRPYSPEMKPHVERFIGTMNHSLFARLPGFSGHSVYQAQALRAQVAYARRQGVDDPILFEATLDRDRLQLALDHWIAIEYSQRPHGGLEKLSPAQMAEQLGEGIRGRVASERDLDLLLMEPTSGGGIRTVQKDGVRVDGGTFIHGELGLYTLRRILVRQDPYDLGTIHCFDPADGHYICAAIDARLAGESRIEHAMQANALHKRLIQAGQALKQAPAKLGKRLIQATLTGDPIDLVAEIAAPALRLVAPEPQALPERSAAERAEHEAYMAREAAWQAEQQQRRTETEDDRFIRWWQLNERLEAGGAASDDEREWHRLYQTTSEWRGLMRATEDGGTDWMRLRAAG